jgi:SAM-dependent methyltransferase
LLGPGQELGQALRDVPDRARGCALTLAGSAAGILLFACCSAASARPWAWFALVALGLIALAWSAEGRRAARIDFLVPLAVVCALSVLTSGPEWWSGGKRVGVSYWSPYSRVDYDADQRLLYVNQLPHEQMLTRFDDLPEYQLPHLLRRDSGGKPFEDVLVIGAGSGNDTASALSWGARRVDAVELDPVIAGFGSTLHPQKPYRDPRVRVVVDDGRNVLERSDRLYDAVIVQGSQANSRLASSLFTREALQDAARLLKPNGVLVLYNYYSQGWIVGRLQKTLAAVFGREPVVLGVPYRESIGDGPGSELTIMMAGDVEPIRRAFAARGPYRLASGLSGPRSPNGFARRRGKDAGERIFAPARVELPPDLEPPVDDWPFLYLRSRMIPGLYLRSAGLIALLTLAGLWLAAGPALAPLAGGRTGGALLALGAGFMLLATKVVAQLALLFGGRWTVNVAAILVVLALAAAGSLLVLFRPPRALAPYWAGLAATLLLGLTPWAREIAGCCAVLSPVFFSGVVFSSLFAETSDPDLALALSLLGALAGGLLESASMLLGFRLLGLLALAVYAAAWALRPAPARLG